MSYDKEITKVLSARGMLPMADIINFHEKFNLVYDGKPRSLPEDIASFRQDFLEEELKEYRVASLLIEQAVIENDEAEITRHLESQLDALVDLVYVALGTAYLHGFDFSTAWARVHKANMAKVRAKKIGDSTRGSTYDVVKPQGWKPPSHTDLVEDHAHHHGELPL